MTNTISSKPNYAIPFANLPIENYQNGYWQEGQINRLGGNYKVGQTYNLQGTDNRIGTWFDGKNKYGEYLRRCWAKNNDGTIDIERTKTITYIEDLKTGLLRQLTTEEKEKLLREGITSDEDVCDSKKAKKLLCNENERLVRKNEILSLTKKNGEKWKVNSYRLGDLFYNEIRGSLSSIPEQTNIIDRRAYRAIGDFVENLSKKFRRV